MHVSYAELVRICPESIRMTGFSYGQADDAVEGIVWSECVLSRGYYLLRMADERRPSDGWPKHAVNVRAETATVELAEMPIYGLAARLADLAAELAMSSPHGRAGEVRAYGAFGGWIAPYMAYRLARNAMHAAVFWRPAEPAPTGEAPAMLLLVSPALPDGQVPPLTMVPAEAAKCSEYRIGDFPRSLLDPILRANKASPERSLIAIAATTVSLTGAPDETIRTPEILGALGLLGCARSLDAAARLESAVKLGMDVRAEGHALLNALSQRIRMPNTERSKSQAG